MLKSLLLLLLTLAAPRSCHSFRLSEQRVLVGEPYFRTNDTAVLGAPNNTAALGNPLKGLMGGIRWSPPPLPDNVPSAVEGYELLAYHMAVTVLKLSI